MAFIQSKLKQLYIKRPRWIFVLYYRMPSFLRNIINRKARSFKKGQPTDPLNQLPVMPLDESGNEVVIAPFHDPHISGSLPFKFEVLNAKGHSKEHSWCWTVLSWFGCPENEDAVYLTLQCNLDLNGYDGLILCLTVSAQTCVRAEIQIDGQWNEEGDSFDGLGERMELVLPVKGDHLNAIRLTFASHTELAQSAQLSWFGLQKSERIKTCGRSMHQYDNNWFGLIRPPEVWGDPEFEVGLIFSETKIPYLREKKEKPGWNTNFALLEQKAAGYMKRIPEQDIGTFSPSDDRRYIRRREQGKTPYYFEALVLGFVGLVKDDRAMMFHALRYLMSMVHTTHWAQSAESRLKGSTWDQRCFMEELTTSSVAILADWFAFALTDRAKDLIRQSIWDKGLSVIDRDMKKFEYLYHINQGSVFCRARVLGGLYLEQGWFRMGSYVEQAFSDMLHCLGNYVESDGGLNEGVGYFCQTFQAVLPTTIAYARSKGVKPEKLIKKYFSKCENYIQVMSGTLPGTAIVEGDCRTRFFSGDAIPIFARCFPGGASEKILGACIEEGSLFEVTGTLRYSGGIFGFVLGPEEIKAPKPASPVFSVMKKTGHLASHRSQKNRDVRFQIIGSRPNPSHSHYDKGSILLEIDSEPVLIDRGMVYYHHSDANLLKRSDLHNVVTPVAEDGTFPNQQYPSIPIIPSGKGNEVEMEAKVDLGNVWKGYMKSYVRSVNSSDFSEIVVTDKGRLLRKGRVAFHLQSNHEFQICSKEVYLESPGSGLHLVAPWARKITCREESIDLMHDPVYHLIIESAELVVFDLKTTLNLHWAESKCA